MISIHELQGAAVQDTTIWDMLAGRGMSNAEQMALIGGSPGELPAIMVTSCLTAEDIRTRLDFAVEVNDGRSVMLVYEGDMS